MHMINIDHILSELNQIVYDRHKVMTLLYIHLSNLVDIIVCLSLIHLIETAIGEIETEIHLR